MKLDGPGWNWPVPNASDGRKPQISDGYHPVGSRERKEGHRGQDIMYRRPSKGAPIHPWKSPWYEMFPSTPALAAHDGDVFRAGNLLTGWHVILEHGDHVATAYHHLSHVFDGIDAGVHVKAGTPLGVVGGSPVGYGLVHLHFDLAVKGHFIDAAPYMRRWSFVEAAGIEPAT